MAKLLLGPVVGHVTSTSAIILLEVDSDVILQCQLSVAGGDASKNKMAEATFRAGVAGVYELSDLEPGTAYSFTVPQIAGRQASGSLRTFPVSPSHLRVAAVSCDAPKRATSEMWTSLSEQVSGVHVCLHIGDNVYLDENLSHLVRQLDDIVSEDHIFDAKKVDQSIPYVRARRLLRQKPQSEWAQYTEEITKLFKDQYREKWSRYPKCHVLANTSNLMILDDHDIRDDFGCSPQDADTNSKEFFLNRIAMTLYHEYQRQLWDPDVVAGGVDRLENEFYTIQSGPMLIVMLDARTHKAIYKHKRQPGDDSYYGKPQWDAFKKSIAKAEEAKARILLVNSTMPLFFLKARITRFLGDKQCCGTYAIPDDMKAFINYNSVEPHDKPTPELVELMDIISRWKSAGSGKSPSTALILSGDVHIGGFTDIYTEDQAELVCRQICTGPVTLKNYKTAQHTITRAALSFTDTYNNLAYNHYDWTKNSNYVIIDFDLSEEALEYTVTMRHTGGVVKNHSVIDSTHKEQFWDKGKQGGCCEVL